MKIIHVPLIDRTNSIFQKLPYDLSPAHDLTANIMMPGSFESLKSGKQ